MPTKYPADGKLFVGWLEDPTGEAIADVTAPTEAELSTIVDLSCEIKSGGFEPGITTGVTDAKSICSANVAQGLGQTNVSPKVTFWRFEQPDDTAWELVEKGAAGWLVWRTGVDSADPLEDGQDVSLGWFLMSDPAPEFPGGDTNATFVEQFVLQNGQMFEQKAVIGGGS